MARRRVEVVYLAEMSRYSRGMRTGKDETRQFRNETKDAQREVARLGSESSRAADEVSRSAKRAAANMRSAAGDFGRAGSRAGRAFGDGFTRDAQGRLRTADGRFAAEGERLGDAVSRGLRRGARRGGGSLFGDAASVFSGGRAMLFLAGGAAAAVGALQGIPPILSAIGGGLAGIPSLAAGATGAIASIGLGLHGVGDAIGEIFDPPTGGGGGGGFDDTASKLRRVESAERSLARAQRDAKLAQVEVAQARRQATRDLRDMQIALGRVALDERDAQLSLEEAQQHLAELQSQARAGAREAVPFTSVSRSEDVRLELHQVRFETQPGGGADPLEIRRAQLAVDQAKQSILETRAAAQDLRADQAAAARAGVEGSEQVQAALRRQADAQEAVIDATNSLKDAQEALSRSAAGGGAAIATAYSKLSPNAKAFVDEIRDLKDELVGVQQLAQEHLFAGLDKELEQTAKVALPFARKEVARFADTWNDTFTQLFRLGRNPQFLKGLDAAFASSDRFFDKVNARIPVTGRLLSNLFIHSTPFVDRFGDSLLSYVDDFADFIDDTARDGRLDRFFADAAEQADALLDIGKELFRIIARIGGMREGSTLLRDMADALKRFNDTAHDTRDLNAIIDAGNEAIRGVVNVLVILGETLGETLADPSTREAIGDFFEVLGTGAEAVRTLVGAFNRLPGPIKEVALVGGALYLVGGRLSRLFGPLGDVLGRFNTRLGQTGPAGARAATGLGRAGRAARAAGTAFIAMEAVTALLPHVNRELNPQVDALAVSLGRWADGAQLSGEAARVLGDNMDDLNQGFKYLADTDNNRRKVVRWGQDLLEEVVPRLNETDRSLTRTRERVVAFDSALAQLVQGGNTERAQEVFARFAAEQGAQGVSMKETLALFPQYSAALEVAGDKASGAAGGVGEVRDAADDAATKVRALKDAFDALFGAAISTDRANLNYKQGLEDLADELEHGRRTLNTNTQAGRDNVAGILDQIDKIENIRQANLDNNVALGKANKTYDTQLSQLRKTLLSLGYNKEAVDALIGKYRELPKKAETQVNAPGADAAKKKVEDFNFVIRKLPNGKVVSMTVNAAKAYDQAEALRKYLRSIPNETVNVALRLTGTSNVSRQLSNIRKQYANRWGGLYEHAQEGLLREADIFPPRIPARYAFAEAGTGGEAFIPRYGDRDRSIAIGRRAMEWYGYAVVPQSAMRGSPAAATVRSMSPAAASPPPVVNVTVTPVAPNGDRLTREIIRTIRYTVDTEAGGSVQRALGDPRLT